MGQMLQMKARLVNSVISIKKRGWIFMTKNERTTNSDHWLKKRKQKKNCENQWFIVSELSTSFPNVSVSDFIF